MQEVAGEQGAAYIPMPKGRGFTPHFDKPSYPSTAKAAIMAIQMAAGAVIDRSKAPRRSAADIERQTPNISICYTSSSHPLSAGMPSR